MRGVTVSKLAHVIHLKQGKSQQQVICRLRLYSNVLDTSKHGCKFASAVPISIIWTKTAFCPSAVASRAPSVYFHPNVVAAAYLVAPASRIIGRGELEHVCFSQPCSTSDKPHAARWQLNTNDLCIPAAPFQDRQATVRPQRATCCGCIIFR